MARKEEHRTARFELEPDGFSIHTFELWCQLTHEKYQEIREYLYSMNDQEKKPCTYPNAQENIVCRAFSENGIGLTLEATQHVRKQNGTSYSCYGLRTFVSPRRLLNPGTSYLGILEPEEAAVDTLEETFKELFSDTPIPKKLKKYKATRVDLCTNIRCDNRKLFREMVRVIRKLPTPPKYQRKFRKTNTKGMCQKEKKAARKADNKYNKHYFKVACDSCDLVIYDKGYQVTAEGLEEIGYENLPHSVLRFECRLLRHILRKEEKQHDLGNCVELLKYLIRNSEILLTERFAQYFAEAPFCRFDEIERRIEQSKYRKPVKKTMLEFSKQLRRAQIVDHVFERMEKEGWKFDRKNLLSRFQKLGISPIPLWNNFCAKQLPSPVTLLKEIADGEITVDYIIVK